jgi:hypothetical protein
MSHLTPTAERLHLALDTELRRMQNEWFFKWHFIGRDGPVEIDAFDGRTLRYNMVAFFGTTQLVFWETIERYLRQKVAAVFDGLEEELARYPQGLQPIIIDQAVPIIRRFADAIRREAVEKDRVLRGNGFELPTPHDRGQWAGARAGEIERRAAMVKEIYGAATAEEGKSVQINITGANGRVNFQSTDNSTNISRGLSSAELGDFLAELEAHKAGLPVQILEDSAALIVELKAEAAKQEINEGKVKAGLQSLKTITEGAAGNLVASGITGLIAGLLSHL